LEDAVLHGLQDRHLTPELTDVFVREYTDEVNRVRAEANASHDEANRRRTSLHAQIDNLVDSVAAGRASPALLDRLEEHEAELGRIKAELAASPPDPVRIHPNIANFYVEKVQRLRECLNQEETREEAAGIIRGLVDEIRLHPIDGAIQIELKGDLATLLGFADHYDPDDKKPGSAGDPGCTKWLVAGARKALGGIDILVNNAGHSAEKSFEDLSVKDWDRMIAVHLRGTFLASRACYGAMCKRGWGRIINIASQHALKGTLGKVHYCAANAGIIGLTKALAREGAPSGVLVNAVAPGPVETNLLGGLSDEWRAAKLAELPLGRFAGPEEIAPTAVMLASEGGAYYVGQTLSPNGGDIMA
jgi:3-oxoacyl-[acyl-carrier protein] reductase